MSPTPLPGTHPVDSGMDAGCRGGPSAPAVAFATCDRTRQRAIGAPVCRSWSAADLPKGGTHLTTVGGGVVMRIGCYVDEVVPTPAPALPVGMPKLGCVAPQS